MEQTARDVLRCCHQLFEVVEQQEELLLPKMHLEAFEQSAVAAFPDSQHVGERGKDEFRIADGSQRDKADSISRPIG